MKINNSYRTAAMSHWQAVSAFRSLSVATPSFADISRVVNACGNRIQWQGTSLSAAQRSIQLHDETVQITADTALMPSTGKPSGTARRGVKGAPRGIPPRSKPKWA